MVPHGLLEDPDQPISAVRDELPYMDTDIARGLVSCPDRHMLQEALVSWRMLGMSQLDWRIMIQTNFHEKAISDQDGQSLDSQHQLCCFSFDISS